MRLAETVTFGGSSLDRAAELRGGEADALGRDAAARYQLFWRGKPLADRQRGDRLLRIGADHPLIRSGEAAAEGAVFLGRSGPEAIFALDLSGWEPEGVDHAALDLFSDQSWQHHPSLPEQAGFAELRGIMAALDPLDAEIAASGRAILGWHRTHGFCARCGALSRAEKSGWQRRCGSCGALHFPRTDPVVIMLVTCGNEVLLGRSHGWPEGMYSLPAGFVEPGETIEAAVRREVREETGIAVGRVGYLSSQPWPYPSSLMIGCRGESKGGALRVDPEELEDALWLSREEILDIMAGRREGITLARKGSIANFLLVNWLADRLE